MALITRLRRFFLFCAGISFDIIDQCPESEATKYLGIGASVFFTSLFGAVSMSYALYRVFGNDARAILSSIVLGLVWAAFIFTFDRWMVSSMRRKRQAIPRIVFATLIASVISAPIDVRLFSARIARQLLDTRQKEMLADQRLYSSYYHTNSLLSTEKSDRQAVNIAEKQMWEDPPGSLFQNALRNLHVAQVNQRRIDTYAARELPPLNLQLRALGKELTNADRKLQNTGPQSLGELTHTSHELAQQRATLQARIASIRSEQHEAVSRLRTAQGTVDQYRRNYHEELAGRVANLQSLIGKVHKASAVAEARAATDIRKARKITSATFNGNLMSQVEALGRLTSNPFTTLWWARTLVFLVILSMETAPIVTKLLSPRGPYEVALEVNDEARIARSDALRQWLKTEDASRLFQEEIKDTFRYELARARIKNAKEFACALQKQCDSFYTTLIDLEAKLLSKQSTRLPEEDPMAALDRIAHQFWDSMAKIQDEFKSEADSNKT